MDEEKQVEELENNMPEEINQQEESAPEVRRTGENLAQEEKEEPKDEGQKEKKPKKKKRMSIITLILLILVAIAIVVALVFLRPKNTEETTQTTESRSNSELEKYCISGNDVNDFDLKFLQLENNNENVIYSPLSIKYCLAMINEGASGDTKEQITKVIGTYLSKKYENNEHMSFANAAFIRDSAKDSIKEEYTNALKEKYNADVVTDSFESASTINSWISEKTLNLINGMISDEMMQTTPSNIFLVNSLAIDMDWNQKFFERNGRNLGVYYRHISYPGIMYFPLQKSKNTFENVDYEVSGMEIDAIFNNYDLVGTIGEDNIRKTVGDAYREYLYKYYSEEKTPDEIEAEISRYLESYISDISSNYHKNGFSTEFSFYKDDNIDVFAKDLKQYNGTQLQYVAIIPRTESLSTYIEKTSAEDIKNVISSLKPLESSSFKDGVITEFYGYIPKFKYDYDLKLKDDLMNMGISDLFDPEKSQLTEITGQNEPLNELVHKATIEFTEDGIKAAATTVGGAGGGGGAFDYIYEVPVEYIAMNFNKPYMYLIRDKESGEVWFVGSVYKPLNVSEEKETIHDDYQKTIERRHSSQIKTGGADPGYIS